MVTANDTMSHRDFNKMCTHVTSFCRVDLTVLGYRPNMGASVFFTMAFGICLVWAFSLGVWKKTWTYTAAITIGLILETSGYIGRILLHQNPWNQNAFQLQICAIILAPTFICVSIYLTLKHVALNLNPALSRLPPQWYPRIFLPADLSCLIVQAIGGGIAAAAGSDRPALAQSGNRAIIAGIVLQVLVLAVFGGLATDYFLRTRKHIAAGRATAAELALWRDSKFRKFVYGIAGAYAAIFIRCIYRIAEMAGGWGNHIMQDEISFVILDSTLIFVTVYLLTIFHPGIFFPQMASGHRKNTNIAGYADNTGVNLSDFESAEPKPTEPLDSSAQRSQSSREGHQTGLGS